MAVTVLNKTQLPQLLDRLEQLLPQSSKIHNELKGVLSGKWPGIDYIVDQWPDFKVVITKCDPSKTKCQYINRWCSVYCRDTTVLKTMLEQPTVFDLSKIMFDAVEASLLDIIKEAGSRFGLRVCFEVPCQMLQATAESLILEPIPEHLNMKSLEPTPEIVETIAANWPYSEPGVNDFITQLINTFPSRCLVDKENNLIGYAVGETWMLGMLFVKAEYRGRGYGKVIMSHLAKAYIAGGQSAIVCIVPENQVSIKMHEQIGFRFIPEFTPTWIKLAPV